MTDHRCFASLVRFLNMSQWPDMDDLRVWAEMVLSSSVGDLISIFGTDMVWVVLSKHPTILLSDDGKVVPINDQVLPFREPA